MGSEDLRSAMNYVSQEKHEIETVRNKLADKPMIESIGITRDTEGMDGDKYQKFSETVKKSFETFKSEVEKEKEATITALNNKIRKLENELDDLDRQFRAAVASERAEAERKAAKERADAERRRREE